MSSAVDLDDACPKASLELADAAPRRKRGGWGRRILTVGSAVYVGVVLLLAMLETRLVYPAPPLAWGDWSPSFQYEEVQFHSSDGTELHGWLLNASEPTSRWILYCHGNGDQVANSAAWLDRLRTHLPANIFVFDYRGYGRSQGKPNEEGVLADGEAALKWLCEHTKVQPSDVVLFGRSLGGAVAVHLAVEHGAKAIVLERTFTRLTDAARANYWWIPVQWFMRNRYPSIEKIGKYQGPLLLSHGELDTLVPYEQGKALFDAAGTPDDQKEFVTLKGTGHNGPDTEEYRRKLVAFLRQYGG